MSTTTPIFHSGFGGTASVGTPTVELPIRQWSFTFLSETVAFKNSKSGATPIREATYQDCTDLSLEIDYDFAANPFIATPALTPGTNVTEIKLYLHQTGASTLDGPFWLFASVIVKSVSQKLVRDGAITTQIICQTCGPITPPAT